MRLVLTMSTKFTSLAALFYLSSVIALTQHAAGDDQTRHQLKGDVPGSSALHVKIEGGSIRLEGYSGDRISYQVRSLPSKLLNRKQPDVPRYKVATYMRGGASWLVATPQKDQPSARTTERVVRVPRSLPFVALDTSGGDVNVGGVEGRLQVTTGGGHLQITDVRGVVSAETGGQDIDVGTVDGDGRFHTGGGRIAVDYIKGNLDAFTGG